jgi:hypothetical protein
LTERLFRFFIVRGCSIIRLARVRDLLHQKAVAIAMWRFMFALRACNMLLIEPKQQIIEGDGIKLYGTSGNAEPCKKP